MSDSFKVRSLFCEYVVEFIDGIVARLAEEVSAGAVVVIDERLLGLYPAIAAVIPAGQRIAIPAREESKDLDACRRLIEDLVGRGFRRDGRLVAVGGGIVQDVTAFSASILYRGVEWMFVPTTLLAQADSCLGSKTSINLSGKKNLIGNFYPPSRILIDPIFLASLSADEIKSGIGEMLHFFYYCDHEATPRLAEQYDRFFQDRSLLLPFIRASLQIKRTVAELDEFDRGERNKFNYGHTFGHALESATDYAIPHGQAVTVGMDIANWMSVHEGLLDIAGFDRMHIVLRRNFPSSPAADLAAIDLGRYMGALSKDKKNVGSDLVCILSHGPGRLERVQLALDATRRGRLERYFCERVWAAASYPAGAA